MTCPFLRTARVRYCHGPTVRKPILESASAQNERCTTPAYRECSVYLERPEEPLADQAICPMLDETLTHYCGAAPVAKYVPFSDHAGRCGSDGFRFCELWLTMAHPSHQRHPDGEIDIPKHLSYSTNHLWLHTTESGTCHVGIDAFFARLLPKIDRISFVTTQGIHRPTAVLTVDGVDWQVVFPNLMLITSANVYLRHAPSRLLSDPYGAGWLFEGWQIPADTMSGGTAGHGLVAGEQAARWVAEESARLDEFVHHLPSGSMNDGGSAGPDLLQHLTRDEVFQLFNEFFAPHAGWAKR